MTWGCYWNGVGRGEAEGAVPILQLLRTAPRTKDYPAQHVSSAEVEKCCFQINKAGNSLVVQWLGLGAFTVVARGSIPGRGTKIPASRVAWPKNKNKNEIK